LRRVEDVRLVPIVHSYRDLVVWQKRLQLIDEIDALVASFNTYQRWSLGMQMHRAAYSIVLNIAEGNDHDFSRVYLRNLADAKGSAREVEAALFVVRHCLYLPEERTTRALKLVDEIGRMLRSLSARVRRSLEVRREQSSNT